MAEFLFYLAPLLMVGVAIILFFGIWNFARGGGSNLSQRLMRFRVLAQLIAVIVMLSALYFAGR